MKFRSTLITVAAIVWTSGVTNFEPVLAKSNDPILQQAKRANKDRRYDEAIKLLDRALQQQPDLADDYLERGKSKYYLNKNKAAIEDFDRALQHKSNFAEAYLARGKAKYSLDEDKAAIEDFDLALKYRPNFADAYLERGKFKYYLDKNKAAIEDFDLALKYNPNLIDAYIERGRNKSILKQYTSAIEDFDRAIAINPKSIGAYAWRGTVYRIYLKQKERGNRDFDLALKIEPKSSGNYADLALIFIVSKNYQPGIDFFTKEIATSGEGLGYAYWWRAVIYNDMAKYELAIADYQSFLKSKPEVTVYSSSSAYQHIASNYLSLQKYTETINYVRKSLKLNPKNDAALADRGSAFYYLENYFTALEDFNAAVAISPKTGGYYHWRGLVYTYGLNDYQRGIAEFDRAVTLGHSSASLYRNRGYAKQRLDRSWNIPESAVADYQQALKLARQDGNKELERSLLNSIEDSQTQIQRMFLGTAIALLLTGIGYYGLDVLIRRNEAKYLQQLTKQDFDSLDLI
jgi:tetratricopeptide (TPR) repeat protein